MAAAPGGAGGIFGNILQTDSFDGAASKVEIERTIFISLRRQDRLSDIEWVRFAIFPKLSTFSGTLFLVTLNNILSN